METNLFGLLISFGFLFTVIATAKLLMLLIPSVSSEFIRKFIHIAVTNWWFIMVTYLTNIWALLLGPIFFIIVNSLATFLDWAKFFGMTERTRNFGLIYFPISLMILALLMHAGILPAHIAGMSFFVMGYGDGLAGVIGRKFGKQIIKGVTGTKTYVGSATMFLVSVCVITLFSIGYSLFWIESRAGWVLIVVSAAMATLFEALTPWGLDNVTVPIGTAIVLRGLEKYLLKVD
jgi:phytol kinase